MCFDHVVFFRLKSILESSINLAELSPPESEKNVEYEFGYGNRKTASPQIDTAEGGTK